MDCEDHSVESAAKTGLSNTTWGLIGYFCGVVVVIAFGIALAIAAGMWAFEAIVWILRMPKAY